MQQILESEYILNATQLFKTYRDDGGTKTFSEWLTREKTKGIFPLNGGVNDEVQKSIKVIKQSDMKKTVLGFPMSTLAVVGVVIIGAIVVSAYMKKKQ